MITGINLMETEKFVSKYDKGEPKTVWKIGVLDSEQMVAVEPNDQKILKTMTTAVRFGLKGFEKFTDNQGNEIAFKTEKKIYLGKPFDVVADDVMKIIPTHVILELGTRIMQMAELSEEEAKN